MKNKSLLKKTVLTTGISTILILSMVNSVFIRESNAEIALDSNVKTELKSVSPGSHYIDDYSINRTYQSGGSVSYSINYKESGVWYWDQKPSDYVKRNWNKYAHDSWYYGPAVSLGSAGDDNDSHSSSISSSYLPTFTIRWNDDRPGHWVDVPSLPDPGSMINPYDPDGMGDNPDTHDEWEMIWVIDGYGDYGEEIGHYENILVAEGIDESQDDSWIEQPDKWVDDSYPSPYSAFSDYGWTTTDSYDSNNVKSYTFTWTNHYSKMNSFPKLKDGWIYTSQDSGDWNQFAFDHWDWSTSGDYWKSPTRKETGKGNKSIYVDWEITYNDKTVQEGTQNIFTSDVIEQSASSFAASQDKSFADYSTTDKERHSSTPPSITVPEPKDSDWYGVKGSSTININNLPLGNEYHFDANLMYENNYGDEILFDTFHDEFTTSKNAPRDTIDLFSYSDNEQSVGFGYVVTDEQNVRLSPVKWEVNGDMGTHYEGVSTSNYFEQTFDVAEGEMVNFIVDYDYSLSNDYNGNPLPTKTSTESISQTTDTFYDDEVEEFDVWIDNVQQDYFIFNYYIAMNNNQIDNDSYITIEEESGTGLEYYIDDLKPGTQSFKINTISEHPELYSCSKEFKINLHFKDKEYEKHLSLNNQTNLITDYNFFIKGTPIITNTEALVTYEIDDKLLASEVTSIKYHLNDEVFEMDLENLNGNLILENLKEEWHYELWVEVNTPVRDYYSNTIKFKTDRSTDVYIPKTFAEGDENINVGENSASFTFEIDKYTYLDDKTFKWAVVDKDDDKVLYERSEDITHNGEYTIYADRLKSNHDYKIVINIEVEGQTKMLYQNFTTERKNNDTINNSYITNIKKQDGKFEIEYEGSAYSLQYTTVSPEEMYSDSLGTTESYWKDVSFVDVKEGKILTEELDTVNGYISFRINNQMRSQSYYFDGVNSTIVIPKEPINWNWTTFWIVVLILFVIITITLATVWGVIYIKSGKDENKFEGNIWRN